LNLRSRLRYLSSGFYNLFGPLLPDESAVHTTRGHINPVNCFYLSHALLSIGFRDLRVTVDKYQRRSLLAFPFLIVPLMPQTGLFILVTSALTARSMKGMLGPFE
jgi:hypothetical protein